MKYVMGLCEKKTSTANPFGCSTHKKYARMISLIRWEEEVRGLNINVKLYYKSRNRIQKWERRLLC